MSRKVAAIWPSAPSTAQPKKVALSDGQLVSDEPIEHGDENQRERKTEAEAHEGRAGRAHHGLQVLLRRRAQILQKGGGDGDRDPEFHAEAFRKGRAHNTNAACPAKTKAVRSTDQPNCCRGYFDLVASQITWRAPRLPRARVLTSSTSKPDCLRRAVKLLSGCADQTASTPPGVSAVRAADSPSMS